MKIVHGYTVEPKRQDPLVALTEETIYLFSVTYVPLAWIVDSINSLQFLPGSLPGIKSKGMAHYRKKICGLVNNGIYDFAQRLIEKDAEKPSLVSSFIEKNLQNSEGNETMEDAIKYTALAAVLYAGGQRPLSQSSALLFSEWPHISRVSSRHNWK